MANEMEKIIIWDLLTSHLSDVTRIFHPLKGVDDSDYCRPVCYSAKVRLTNTAMASLQAGSARIFSSELGWTIDDILRTQLA